MNTIQIIALASIFVLPMAVWALVGRKRRLDEERGRVLRELTASLTPRGVRVLELHREGYNYLEIAGVMGITGQVVLDELTTIYASLSEALPVERAQKRSVARLVVARFILRKL
jgi:DNA-binding CsgD family transcriptional regulator